MNNNQINNFGSENSQHFRNNNFQNKNFTNNFHNKNICMCVYTYVYLHVQNPYDTHMRVNDTFCFSFSYFLSLVIDSKILKYSYLFNLILVFFLYIMMTNSILMELLMKSINILKCV